MFDIVNCDFELPWPEANDLDHAWQTKSLGCDLIAYEISKGGAIQMVMDNEENELELCADVDGEVEIHTSLDGFWYSVRFWFRDGIVQDMICSKHQV